MPNLPIAPCVTFNPEYPGIPGGLFVIESGGGYSCLGLEVAKRRALAILAWLGTPATLDNATPAEVWAAHSRAMAEGAKHYASTGQRCNAELIPALIGKEGMRVEVCRPEWRTLLRFTVGKSTGWLPIHLALARPGSSGGVSAYVPAGSIVRIIASK